MFRPGFKGVRSTDQPAYGSYNRRLLVFFGGTSCQSPGRKSLLYSCLFAALTALGAGLIGPYQTQRLKAGRIEDAQL